jgi:hypothetical protein
MEGLPGDFLRDRLGGSLAEFDRLEPRHIIRFSSFTSSTLRFTASRDARDRSGVIFSVPALSSCSPRKGNVQMIDYKKEFLESLRIYSAPLIGAWNAIVEEFKKLERQPRA